MLELGVVDAQQYIVIKRSRREIEPDIVVNIQYLVNLIQNVELACELSSVCRIFKRKHAPYFAVVDVMIEITQAATVADRVIEAVVDHQRAGQMIGIHSIETVVTGKEIDGQPRHGI